jgi:hypothetical protein
MAAKKDAYAGVRESLRKACHDRRSRGGMAELARHAGRLLRRVRVQCTHSGTVWEMDWRHAERYVGGNGRSPRKFACGRCRECVSLGIPPFRHARAAARR